MRRPHPRPGITKRVGWTVAVGAALLVAALAPRAARAQDDMPAELKTIEEVRFEGRRHVSEKELRSALKTKSPSWMPWRQRPILRLDFLRADSATIEFVYRQHGYLEARSGVRREPGKKRESDVITFVIHEGPRFRIDKVSFEGVSAVPEGTLRNRLHSEKDRPFNPLYLVADTARIAETYRDRGYLPRVAAGAERGEANKVNVVYMVAEGPQYRFGEVYLSSAAPLRIRDELLRREFMFKSGEVFRASRVTRTVEELYRTGLFSQVQMTPLPDSTNRVVEFDLRVRERPRRWVDAGIGSGTAERFRATGEWGHRNLQRRGLQSVLIGRLAFDDNARFILGQGELTFYDPWILGGRRRGLMSLYYAHRNDYSNVASGDPGGFQAMLIEQDERGFNFEVRRYYSGRSQLVLTQKNTYVDQVQSFIGVTLDSAGIHIRDSLSRTFVPKYSTHSIQLVATRDRRDDLFNPSRGHLYQIGGEVAGGPLQGTSSFTKAEVAASWYWSVTQRWVLASRVRGGIIDPFGEPPQFSPGGSTQDPIVARVPLNDRFRIGGVNSLRGYDENQIPFGGGLTMALANLELRIPLVGPIGAELFIDAGNVWSGLRYFKLDHWVPGISDEPLGSDDVRVVIGAGGRLNLPFGPLRLDVSWKARPEPGANRRPRVQFALGPSF